MTVIAIYCKTVALQKNENVYFTGILFLLYNTVGEL